MPKVTVILLNKPFDTLCQFSDGENRPTLATHLNAPEHKGYYPAGRLDRDSEGLVLLTNHGPLQHRISDPKHKLAKTYWVQVEGEVTDVQQDQLRRGITLKDGPTLPAKVKKIGGPNIWTRDPPIRIREKIPTSWLEITLTEGRNRQVRRMTAAVGCPTLRLIRYSIGGWTLGSLQPGEHLFNLVELPNLPAPVRQSSNKRL
ncbi:MAG: 23S rRNA pseudouridine2457 synthase [Lentisphaeria bacterium]|jgi:23S rRNA pseudouridine2457 synthase